LRVSALMPENLESTARTLEFARSFVVREFTAAAGRGATLLSAQANHSGS
jgi:hypothetical protein